MACGGLVNSFYPLLTAQNTFHDSDTCVGLRTATPGYHHRRRSSLGRRSTQCVGVRRAGGQADPHVAPCGRGWGNDPDGRIRAVAPRRRQGSLSGYEMEQGARSRHPADLVATGLELSGRPDHLGGSGADSSGDHNPHWAASSTLNRSLCWVERRQDRNLRSDPPAGW